MKNKLICIFTIALLIYSCNTTKENKDSEYKSEIESIVNRIKIPQFAERTCNIVDFDAIPGGSSNCKPAIDSAINVCSRNGGG